MILRRLNHLQVRRRLARVIITHHAPAQVIISVSTK